MNLVMKMIANGIDFVQIKRFEKLITNPNFLEKTFTSEELKYIQSIDNNLATIAGIYASKEAFLKAIHQGINAYPFKDIEVFHNEDHAPSIVLHNQIKKDISYREISLSISHDGEYAVASIVLLF